MTIRIAMWSGTRNISTAMLRSWENRPDTYVCDEPLYAYYLNETGIKHPGRKEVIESGETDWKKVTNELIEKNPENREIFYQKHMTHHLLPNIEREWMKKLRNCFLIRDPKEVILSYSKTRSEFTIEDIGILQQKEIFDYILEMEGESPPIIDSKDVLENPKKILEALCKRLKIPFYEQMLKWPKGERDTDGIWGKYWYHNVITTSEFMRHQPKNEILDECFEEIYEKCLPYYEKMHGMRIK